MHRPVGRILTGGVLVATLHAFAEPSNYLAAVQAVQQKEANIREIAAKMNVDPEFLLNPGGRRSFDFRSLFNTVAAGLGMRSEAVTANAQPESVRESIAKVKECYAIVAADTTLAKIAQLLDIAATAPIAKLGRVKAENFPFVPSTLTTKIDEVRGLGAAPPADQVQSVTIDIVTATGAVVGTFTTAVADVWGKKLSLTFPPATPDDAAVIAQDALRRRDTPGFWLQLSGSFRA